MYFQRFDEMIQKGENLFQTIVIIIYFSICFTLIC